jgi:hypothetical protein
VTIFFKNLFARDIENFDRHCAGVAFAVGTVRIRIAIGKSNPSRIALVWHKDTLCKVGWQIVFYTKLCAHTTMGFGMRIPPRGRTFVNKDYSGDPLGVRCPIGAHIRRVNPRGQPIKGQGMPGGSNNNHRLLRRGMPYGPAYVPGEPDDGIERGLLGYIINASIENQFEFVMREWINGYEFVGATRLNPKSKDLIASRESDPTDSIFEIPQADGVPPRKITGFSSFVTTRATAYCFLPSITALKFIANLT